MSGDKKDEEPSVVMLPASSELEHWEVLQLLERRKFVRALARAHDVDGLSYMREVVEDRDNRIIQSVGKLLTDVINVLSDYLAPYEDKKISELVKQWKQDFGKED